MSSEVLKADPLAIGQSALLRQDMIGSATIPRPLFRLTQRVSRNKACNEPVPQRPSIRSRTLAGAQKMQTPIAVIDPRCHQGFGHVAHFDL